MAPSAAARKQQAATLKLALTKAEACKAALQGDYEIVLEAVEQLRGAVARQCLSLKLVRVEGQAQNAKAREVLLRVDVRTLGASRAGNRRRQ